MHRYVQNRVLVYLKTALVLTDAISLNIVFLTAFFGVTRFGWVHAEDVFLSNYYSLWMTYNLVAVVCCVYSRLHENNTSERLANVFRQTCRAAAILSLVFTGCVLIGYRFTGAWYFIGAIFALIAL